MKNYYWKTQGSLLLFVCLLAGSSLAVHGEPGSGAPAGTEMSAETGARAGTGGPVETGAPPEIGANPEQETENQEETQPKVQPGWVKKSGQYYWRNEDNTIRRQKGWFDAGGKRYYLNKRGARISSIFKKIDEKYYWFNKKGVLYQPRKAGYKTIAGAKYYFYKDGHCATGVVKIGKFRYYFSSKGKLQTNKYGIKLGGKYYSTDKKGKLTKLSAAQVTCRKEAGKFIKKHSSASQTKAQKFRACFNYMKAYMKYVPGYFPTSRDYAILNRADGVYQMANQMFRSPVLWGNCHRFACCLAAVAKELGYEPYVIVTEGDHSFCMIDGKYYDNMYGGLFGAASRPESYTVYKKVRF